MITHNYKNELDNQNIIKLLQKKINTNLNKNVLIFGCSNAKCFIRKFIQINNLKIYNNYITGASMLGFTRDNSKTNSQKIITNQITNDENNIYIFKFGQVDVEYVNYYKNFIKMENVDGFFDTVIKDYINLILKLKEINKNIIICGINIPNYPNNVNNLKKLLKKNISIGRNECIYNALLFNSLLKKECEKNNIKYFDLTEETTYLENNQLKIKKEFIGLDHHFKGGEMGNIYKKIRTINHGFETHFTFIKKLIKMLE